MGKYIILFFVMGNAHALLNESYFMAQIAINTASQLNELEQLVSNTEKYTKKIMDIADLIDESVYIADRVEMWASDMEYIFEEAPDDLEKINDKIRGLKIVKDDLVSLYRDLSIEEHKNDQMIKKISKEQRKDKKKRHKYKAQATKKRKKQKDALMQTAQNTGAMVVEQSITNTRLSEQQKEMRKLKNHLIREEKRDLAIENERKKAWNVKKKGHSRILK